MLEKHLRALLLIALISPCNSFAAEAFNLSLLQNLFKTYQRQQAYDYASQYLSQMEGDPYFDYLYGVSAIDTGHLSQGIFALERVLLVFPQDQVARLELARGYYLVEEYARARQEFEIVLKTRPPEGVQETTQLFLDKIRLKEARYQTTSNGYIELSMGTDSNVNSSPTEDKYDNIFTIPFTPGSASVEQDDVFTNLAASWQITQPVAPGWLVNAAITGSFRKNADWDQFDNFTATLQAGITRLYKQSRYKADFSTQQYDLDGDTFRKLNSLNLGWHYMASPNTNISTAIQYAALDYPTRSIQNSDLVTLGMDYSHTFTTAFSPTVFASINFGSESAKDSDPDALAIADRDITNLRAGIILGLTNKTALQLAGAIQTSEYAGRHYTHLSANREDDHVSSDLNLLWLFKRDWRLDAKVSYSDNRSNVEIFRYNRTQVSLNLNYAF